MAKIQLRDRYVKPVKKKKPVERRAPIVYLSEPFVGVSGVWSEVYVD